MAGNEESYCYDAREAIPNTEKIAKLLSDDPKCHACGDRIRCSHTMKPEAHRAEYEREKARAEKKKREHGPVEEKRPVEENPTVPFETIMTDFLKQPVSDTSSKETRKRPISDKELMQREKISKTLRESHRLLRKGDLPEQKNGHDIAATLKAMNNIALSRGFAVNIEIVMGKEGKISILCIDSKDFEVFSISKSLDEVDIKSLLQTTISLL